MASFNGSLLSGKIGDLIFYNVGGKTFTRKMPATVKQSKATKNSSIIFGRANKIGAALRKQLLPAIPAPVDKNLHTRLTTAVSKWLRTNNTDYPKPSVMLRFIQGFELTENSSLYKRWNPGCQVSIPSNDEVEVKIAAFQPAKSMSAPKGTVSVKCTVICAGCIMKNGLATGNATAEITFDYNSDEITSQIISLKLPTPKGSIIVTAISLVYMVLKNGYVQQSTAKGYMPAAIVDAMNF